MFSPRNIAIAVAIAVAVVLSSITTSHFSARRVDNLRDSLTVARSQVQSAVTRADSATAQASRQAKLAAAERARSDSLALVSKRAKQSADVAWTQFDSLAATNVCSAACIAAARSARASDSVALATTQDALDAARVANARLKLGLDDTSKALADLRASAVHLSDVSEKVAKRPSLLRRIMPRVGAGATAGLDIHGKPNVVTGITLGYSF